MSSKDDVGKNVSVFRGRSLQGGRHRPLSARWTWGRLAQQQYHLGAFGLCKRGVEFFWSKRQAFFSLFSARGSGSSTCRWGRLVSLAFTGLPALTRILAGDLR